MLKNYKVILFFQNSLILRRPKVPIFPDIIKIVTILIRQSLLAQKNLKELEIMYQNEIYICISGYKKICQFSVKKW